MHQPTRIIYEGDAELAAHFVPEATVILNKTTAVAKTAGVGMFAKTARLSDDVLAYTLYTETQSVILITAFSSEHTQTKKYKLTTRPDFFCGLVRGAGIEALSVTPPGDTDGWDIGLSDKPATTKFFMESFKPTVAFRAAYNIIAEREKTQKLSAGYQPSERLAVDPPNWSDIFPQPSERFVPSQYYKITPSCYSGHMKKLVQYVLGLGRLREDQLSPNDTLADEVMQHGFTMRYDFRWQRTHGLVKASDKRWWLVEISQTYGVLAMPLPLYEDIEQDEGTVLAGSEQAELKDVIAAFGGQPTGECFPTGKDLREAIAAGDILQLLTAEDMAAFYSYGPYSTCWGWAFSSDGHEAHNTAHTIEDFTDGAPIGVGVHYRIVFSIGAINKERKKDEPIATGRAAMVRMARGYLCRPGKKTGAQLHFPEPMWEGGSVFTYDFLQRLRYTRCDTVMNVFFIGKSLQTIRFYYNPTGLPAHTDGTSPTGCGVHSGSYAWTEYSPGGYIPPQFYTNLYDYREKIAPSIAEHTYTAAPGAFSGPIVNDWLDKPQYATVIRVRAIKTRSTAIYTNDGSYISHVACPYGAREAYVIYYYRRAGSTWSRKATNNYIITDPNSATTFRYFFGYPDPKPNDCYSDKDRKVQTLGYAPSGCSYIADAGTWLSQCQVVNAGGGGPGVSGSSVSTEPKETHFAESFLVADTEFRNVPLKVTTGDAARWETKSPDDYGFVKHFDCVFSALGEQHAVFNQRISTAPDDYRTFGSLHKDGDRAFYSYIGVL